MCEALSDDVRQKALPILEIIVVGDPSTINSMELKKKYHLTVSEEISIATSTPRNESVPLDFYELVKDRAKRACKKVAGHRQDWLGLYLALRDWERIGDAKETLHCEVKLALDCLNMGVGRSAQANSLVTAAGFF